jgi:DNA-binding NarL/FixJ family response regulator
MIRILIADDHAIFREGMKQIVAGTKGLAVVGEAENWQELMDIPLIFRFLVLRKYAVTKIK